MSTMDMKNIHVHICNTQLNDNNNTKKNNSDDKFKKMPVC